MHVTARTNRTEQGTSGRTETGRGSLVKPGKGLLVNPGNVLLEGSGNGSWKILETGQLEDDGISSPWDSQELGLPVPGS